MKRFLLPFVVSFLAFIGCQKHPNAATWNLTWTAPAKIWEECYPLGNGHLGMMPDGGMDEVLVLPIQRFEGTAPKVGPKSGPKSAPKVGPKKYQWVIDKKDTQ